MYSFTFIQSCVLSAESNWRQCDDVIDTCRRHYASHHTYAASVVSGHAATTAAAAAAATRVYSPDEAQRAALCWPRRRRSYALPWSTAVSGGSAAVSGWRKLPAEHDADGGATAATRRRARSNPLTRSAQFTIFYLISRSLLVN